MMCARAAVVGYPVKHSLSPLLFGRFAAATGRKVSYRAIEVRPRDLAAALERAGAQRWTGWNVTLPHKIAVMEHLDGLDESAHAAGAANVIHFKQGRAVGHNTDVEGFLAPLERRGVKLRGKRALILGAGGAARAACAALAMREISEVVILNRTPARAVELASRFGWRGGGLDVEDVKAAAAQADLVVHATPVGVGNGGCLIPEGLRWRTGALAYDLVYRPATTEFLRRAAEGGAHTLAGLEMLIYQAAATWRIWFSETLPENVLVRAMADVAREAA